MTLTDFKEKYWNESFERPSLIVEAAITDNLKAAGVTVYTNKGQAGNIYYTIRSTKETCKRQGSNSGLMKEVLSIEDGSFDQLRARHYKYAQEAMEDLSDPEAAFKMVFGYNEPRNLVNPYSGIQLQKPIYNKNKK